MYILNFVIDVVRKPFPVGKNRSWYYRSTCILSLFVFIFIYIFKPFGLHQLKSNTFFICLGFGATTFVGATIYELVLNQIRNIRKTQKVFTFGKWLLNNLIVMFWISIANFLFARLALFGHLEWEHYPTMLYATFVIGLIPLTFIGGFSLITLEKKSIDSKANITPKSMISINNPFLYGISIENIKYIEALQNYVKIVYINNEGCLKNKIERATLKEIQLKVDSDLIVKCHRSYLVNINAIINSTGNSQGLSLTLIDCDDVIPVSRTWVPVFRRS